MKSLKDRFVSLLPAFPPQDFSAEQAEEFLGISLDFYVKRAKFYESEIKNILMSYGRMKSGMTDEEKIGEIRKLISE